MNLQHINVKLFVDGPLQVDLRRFIEIFHVWVSEQSLPELLIDVADYRHVPAGPGVLLVGLQADYAMDLAEDRPGLLYNCKQPLDGTPSDKLQHAFSAVAEAARRLETECDGLNFDLGGCQVILNDRALAPNTPETMAAFEPLLREFLQDSLGQKDAQIERDDRDPRRRFQVHVKLSSPLDIERLATAASN